MKTLFIALLIIITGCSETDSSKLPTQMSEGVVLHGNNWNRGCWIQNTDKYPVRIKLVHDNGFRETIIATMVLEPDAKFTIDDSLCNRYNKLDIYRNEVHVGRILSRSYTY